MDSRTIYSAFIKSLMRPDGYYSKEGRYLPEKAARKSAQSEKFRWEVLHRLIVYDDFVRDCEWMELRYWHYEKAEAEAWWKQKVDWYRPAYKKLEAENAELRKRIAELEVA